MTCSRCGQEKEEQCFKRDNTRSKTGRRGVCKECEKTPSLRAKENKKLKEQNLKRCYKCGKIKNLEDFWKGQRKCIECGKKENKEYRETHKDYFKEKNKEFNDIHPDYHREKSRESFARKVQKEPDLHKRRYQKYRDYHLNHSKERARTINGRLNMIFTQVRSRAENRNLAFDLDCDFVKDLFVQQEGKCPLSGIEFSFENDTPFSPSLDRINSGGGYTKDNVRWVCRIVNYGLNKFGDKIFLQMCEAVVKQQKEKDKSNVSQTISQGNGFQLCSDEFQRRPGSI